MTYERLKQYRTIKRQIELYNGGRDISYLSGVNTARPAVQGGKTADKTADLALALCAEISEQEYQQLCEEFCRLNEFIYGIADLTIREIAKLKFVNGCKYEQIAEIVHFDTTTVSRKLRRYINSQKSAAKVR